jgi:hypothetical protein
MARNDYRYGKTILGVQATEDVMVAGVQVTVLDEKVVVEARDLAGNVVVSEN